MVPSFKSAEVEEYVTNMLTKHGIVKYRDLFDNHSDYSKKNMPTTCEALIRPYTLSPEEYEINAGTRSFCSGFYIFNFISIDLLRIATMANPIRIKPLNKGNRYRNKCLMI